MFEARKWALILCVALTIPALAVALPPQEEAEGDDTSAAEGTEAAGEAAADATDPSATGTPESGEPASATPPPEPKPEMEKGTYTVRLRDLEGRVNRLKEQIFRSKARLSLLAETVLDKKIAGAEAKILFRNEMGGSFRLVKASFLLDGAPIFNKSDEGEGLAEKEIINLFDGPVMPGDHTISAVLHYRGHGYGIFSYLKGYSFKTRSSRTFSIAEGKMIQLEVVGYEKGGVTTPLQERPDVRYIINVGKSEDSLEGEE